MKQVTPIHLLRSFEAAARHTSFTLAAEELHVTQAAISKQIKALEKELNCQLFNRNAHGVSLTQTGERYWHDTRVYLCKIDNITTQLFSRHNTRTIRIRSNISYSVDVLAEKIRWFKTHYPLYTIELTHSVWNSENQHENVDIEIDYRNINPDDKEHHLLQEDLMFPLVSAKTLKKQLDKLPTIHILGYYREWNWWLDMLTSMPGLNHPLNQWAMTKQQEIKLNRNIIRVDNSLIAYKLCAMGIGIALGRSSLAVSYINNGLLKRIDRHSEFTAREGFHLCITATGRTKQACTEFIEFLKTQSD